MKRPGGAPDDSGLRGYGKAYEIIAAAMQFAAAVILMLLLGMWLDGKFGTSPWLLITGLAAGFAVGLYSFLRTVQRVARNIDNEKDGG